MMPQQINEYFKNKTYPLEVEIQAYLTDEQIEQLRKEGEAELNERH